MEIEEILKRIEWLDDERRKDKTIIASLEDRILSYDGNMISLLQKVNDFSGDVTRLGVMLSRIDELESTIGKNKVEFGRTLEGYEKQRAEKEREMDKDRRVDLEGISKSIAEIKKGLEVIPEIKKTMQIRIDEEFRLGRNLEELKKSVDESQQSDEESHRTQRIMEEGRRQDAKRLMDIQAEVGALRKRSDEQRGKVDLSGESVRKLELRMVEVQTAENERRQTQSAFLEKQSMQQLDRDRAWKEWQVQFEEISLKSINLDADMQALDATNRALKRSQQSFEEITQRFDRRVNEITEMQRLAEERFRQEWNTFKTDDQKRWMNYSLAQEEQQRESYRQIDKQNERLLFLEELTQETADFNHQLSEDIQKRLHDILNIAHQWVDGFDQVVGGLK
jgi:hypothetical protein